MRQTEIIRRAIITEKSSALREGGQILVFEVAKGRNKGRRQTRGRAATRGESRDSTDGDRPRESETARAFRGAATRLEEGLRAVATR